MRKGCIVWSMLRHSKAFDVCFAAPRSLVGFFGNLLKTPEAMVGVAVWPSEASPGRRIIAADARDATE